MRVSSTLGSDRLLSLSVFCAKRDLSAYPLSLGMATNIRHDDQGGKADYVFIN